MKIKYQEDPKEWRKSALLTALGLAMLSTVLRWRRHLPGEVWCVVLVFLGLAALGALLQPRWFRGWYRLSLWLGFHSSQYLGLGVLTLLFIFVVTPLGLLLQWSGKDPLQLRRPPKAATCWRPARDCNPLGRMF